MTLRTRLLLALLALALLPTVVFTVFTLDQLGRSTERWFRPGVDRALESAVEVTRTSLARIEATAGRQAQRWGEAWPAGPLPERARRALRADLRTTELDFLQLYRRAGDHWELSEQLAPEGVLAAQATDLSAELDAALETGRPLHSARGALAAAARTADGRAVVAGIWVHPDFFEAVERVGTGTTNYRRLGVLVAVQRQYVWLLVSALVLVLVAVAVMLATSLARGMSRPLSDLARALERVAAGELHARVTPGNARELRQLGDSFNTMAGRLEGAREALRQAEREAAWREVARRLAHEIKNPLTPMRLSLHRLQRRVESVPPGQRAAVQDSLAAMLQEVEHLSELADQFSQYARLPEPRFERVDLAEVARTAANLHEPEGLQLSLEADRPLPVWGDRLLLSRAIHNLLLNACEASPAGATVELRARAEGSEAVVEITDRGPGLPEAVRARVFEPYVSTKQRGSGLGLSLVRDIVSQHRGQVTLTDREAGGACARVALPLLTEENLKSAAP